MLFSSMTFIFLFLPIVMGIYFLVNKSWKNAVLLISSILFYAWGEPKYVAIMLLTIIINYFGAIAISKFNRKKLILIFTILINLGILIYFKYFNFILDNMNSAFNMDATFIDVIMPIGISFYTFQAMSYLIDIYRGDAKLQKSIYKLALYISLFPQLVAGPIVKYKDVDEQLSTRKESSDLFIKGVKRFIIGLAKKMLIANVLGAVVDKIFILPPDQMSVAVSWLGAVFYSLQLFFDFSGYSDMAIGLGLIFGFKFLENFNYPYIAKSITDFWRRWHISLSSWFKQYLYISLGGNRAGKFRTYINLFLVFFATGIWHGASWSFVIWGLWHGFFIIIEKAFNLTKDVKNKIINFIKHIYVILVFIIGWVIFRAPDINYAINYIKNMFGFIQNKPSYNFLYYVDTIEVIALIVGIICSVPLFNKMIKDDYKWKYSKIFVNIYLIILFVLSVAMIAVSTYNPFIYFRF